MTKRNRLAPMIAIACLAVGFGAAGAIGGTQIGSSTILKRGEDTLPQARHPQVASDTAREPSKRLPDHYPLVTPEGTIPVAALSAHGRFRGEKASWDEAPDYVAIPDTGSWEYSDAEIQRLETWQPQRGRSMRAEVTVIRGNEIQGGSRSERSARTDSPAPLRAGLERSGAENSKSIEAAVDIEPSDQALGAPQDDGRALAITAENSFE